MIYPWLRASLENDALRKSNSALGPSARGQNWTSFRTSFSKDARSQGYIIGTFLWKFLSHRGRGVLAHQNLLFQVRPCRRVKRSRQSRVVGRDRRRDTVGGTQRFSGALVWRALEIRLDRARLHRWWRSGGGGQRRLLSRLFGRHRGGTTRVHNDESSPLLSMGCILPWANINDCAM